MSYPAVHVLNALHIHAYTASCATTPVVAYASAPVRGIVKKFTGILGGAITVADCTVTVANVTQGTTIGTFTLTQSGSAAGLIFLGTPASTAVAQVNEDDVISFTPAGATGSNIPAVFKIAIRAQ